MRSSRSGRASRPSSPASGDAADPSDPADSSDSSGPAGSPAAGRTRRPWARRVLAVVAATALAVSFAGVASAVTTKNPVIIVAGTFAGQPVAPIFYAPLADKLRDDGYETRVFGLPKFGLQDIRDTAKDLDALSDRLREQTGAAKVNLIGHSQGGLVARYYVKSLGGAGEVDNVISLAAPHHGTVTASLLKLFGLGTCLWVTSCQQMSVGSSFLDRLNAGDDTIGDVRYTNVGTKLDAIVVPYTSSFMDDDGNNTNITLQEECPAHVVGHVFLPHDSAVYSGIQDALAGERVTLRC